MKFVQILTTDQTSGHVVLLADRDRSEALQSLLSADELSFVQQHLEKDILQFFFARPGGALMVRLIKADKETDENPSAALEAARVLGSNILTELRQYKIEEVCINNLCANNQSLAVAEGMALSSYQFLKHFSQPEKKETPLREIRVLNADKAQVAELNALVAAVFMTRDLVNEPFSHLRAEELAIAAEKAGETWGFEVETLEKEKIESLKMGGLLAVNQASDLPPRFSILEYKPANAVNPKPIVLVGKGVVYDTGGLSLKPSEGMDYMKCDMAGGAVVIGTFVAAAANNLPVHLVGLIPITDNKIGQTSYAPGDVITMYSGATVEVMNTDAEGRIILADALHYAKKYNPELVIDFATLTGAAVRAIGTFGTCYMGTASKTVKQAREESGDMTYERLVEFPLWKEYGEELKSNIADLKNIGSVNAGMITAGKFLEHFIDYPWLHLDIAGPAWLRTNSAYRPKDATGVGVRLTYQFLKNFSQQL
ncbi:MAG: leucyl aminopeptidase [Saprospiraceae bacterium]|nr:leucyl aminopeptidase [Saprospiraceae bacterium]